MSKVKTGIDCLKEISPNRYPKNIAFLCHAASVDANLKHSLFTMKDLFKDRLKAIFAPQHGLVGNVQDNMIESEHFIHPYFQIPVYSLYSETRIPTDQMLKDIDCIFVDLQDVGTRIYTYIYTLTLLMEKCAELGIKVVVLDRPNPINGLDLEGNMLEMQYSSFVGRHPLPVRHGLTIGEVAMMAKNIWNIPTDLEIIEMQGWMRVMNFEQTQLPWVLPSPNLATVDAAFTFVGTVLFEGTNISEGRGTTRSLEIIGHPAIEPFKMADNLNATMLNLQLEGFVLRPIVFQPTFQKHARTDCGGFQIHITDRRKFKPWRVCQILCREFYHQLGTNFQWKQPPYEYEYTKMPVDLINGTDQLRKWVVSNGKISFLNELEMAGLIEFKKMREQSLIYK